MKKSLIQSTLIQQIIVVFFVLALFLPFANKAFHIDDPIYIWVAQHIQHNPCDFYGFSVNWYWTEAPMALVNKNPPLFSYYLAMVGSILGWSEVVMHLASIALIVILTIGIYQLAGLMRAKPLQATLLSVCTPVFLLSGTTVMVDMAMMASFVWAIYLWIWCLENKRHSIWLVIASLLVAVSGLTKYFGLTLIPLLSIYCIWQRYALKRWLPFLIIPVILFALYEWGTYRLYGTGLITDAAEYAVSTRQLLQSNSQSNMKDAILIGLSFMGGGILTPLAFAPMLLNRRRWVIGFGVMIIVILLINSGFSNNHNNPQSWPAFAQLSIFIMTGIGLLVVTVAELWHERDAKTVLLFCWIFGTFIFASLINWNVSGRNILPITPAIGIVIAKRLHNTSVPSKTFSWVGFFLPFTLVLSISILVSYADYHYANEVRSVAQRIGQLKSDSGRKLWFQGHWGFQYYLEQAGGTAIDFTETKLNPDDLIASPKFNSNVRIPKENYFDTVQEMYIYPLAWLSTFNYYAGAGFYSSTMGPLPYTFSNNIKPELCQVLRPRIPLEMFVYYTLPVMPDKNGTP
jgi:4-amino-4-deoxy-L-arabinose transferase-like glycosyltransferase